MRDKNSYLSSLNDGREVYYRGKKIEDLVNHEILKISANHSAGIYDLKDRIFYDNELNSNISKYYKIPRNSNDLLDRHNMIFNHTLEFNGVFNISQAIGSDALFALMITTKKIDKNKGTKYFERVRKFYEYVAKNDLTLTTAQTDVKGDRSKRPSEQVDKDMYVRIVEKRNDGIIVKGAKAHTTQSIFADEIIVIPTRAMTEKDSDYAVAFAIPTNTKGVKMIARPIDEVEGNSSSILSRLDFEVETITIFDNVFVPWDRVFLAGEYEFAGLLANLFATYHRFTAISYRSAMSDLFIGTGSLMAKANGIQDSRHVREDLLNMIMYKEILKMSAVSAAVNPVIDEGIAIPNSLYTNVGKLYTNSHFHELITSLIDISGGILATMPSKEDIENEIEKQYIEKYLRGAIEGKDRIKLIDLAKELSASNLSGYWLTTMIHAEGSIEASKIALLRNYNLQNAEEMIMKILKSEK
ncbi:4-hydroxyphenylacetate 3-hydroxylase N-terminal domain-containing protein [Acidianus manzaensis]|uniref:4-hydroxybutyryl-CoA dehydratase n=1 Tax=Acidianus manzaensis TaxID=282676 RepID=A0A1W6JZ31_9CREN|nr:4-hydroxyphenylacetate 3-hydroxylase N-terminal domain-containing protein [Acidianus manzaensis]ARM75507.1 4-hydroxybutyryl-CoA dehydratase [Acidianus manzaensis]